MTFTRETFKIGVKTFPGRVTAVPKRNLERVYQVVDERTTEIVSEIKEIKKRQEDDFRYLVQKMDALRTEVKGEIGQLKNEVKGEIGQIRGEIGQLKGEMGQLRTEIGAINQRIDTVIQMLMTIKQGQ